MFISLVEVTEVVNQVNSGVGCWVEIHPKMLKGLDTVGLSWLTHLFNDSWWSGTVVWWLSHF